MASGFTIDASTADDHDFLCMGYSSKRARMSCGHTVTAESLNDWCNRQLDDECPGCKYYVQRKDNANLSVHCLTCSAQKGKCYEFCWQCLREWKGRRPRSDKCENDGCTNEALGVLRTCKIIEFKNVKGVTGCPSVRACPTCGYVVEHSSEKCKNIACPDCKVEFCFVCLKLKNECSGKTSSYYGPCSDGVAPRQTSIPARR